MQDIIVAILLGVASGLLTILARRVPWLGWIILAPLAAAACLYSPIAAGLGGIVAGTLGAAPTVWGRLPGRSLQAIATGADAACWSVVFALAAWLWPHGIPAWGALITPVAAVLVSAGPRFAVAPGYGGATRYHDFFLSSQQPWLPVVHIARLGSDLVIPAVLGLAASVPAMLLVQVPPSGATIAVALASVLLVAGALGFGFWSYRRAVRRVDAKDLLPVAAISVDDPFDGYARSPAYRDIEGRILRYQPHVARAAAGGARLIVMPEHAVIVTAETRERWLSALSTWAREGHAIVVAGFFDTELQSGRLAIVDESGNVAATYDKQHPMMGAEPKRRIRMAPALLRSEQFCVSAVICHDWNFNDFIRPVARAGGVLAIPGNDWKEIEELHPPSGVWPAVMAGVPLVRATGHGTSILFDAAGRLVAKASSFAGPVVMMAEVPITIRIAGPATPASEYEAEDRVGVDTRSQAATPSGTEAMP